MSRHGTSKNASIRPVKQTPLSKPAGCPHEVKLPILVRKALVSNSDKLCTKPCRTRRFLYLSWFSVPPRFIVHLPSPQILHRAFIAASSVWSRVRSLFPEVNSLNFTSRRLRARSLGSERGFIVRAVSFRGRVSEIPSPPPLQRSRTTPASWRREMGTVGRSSGNRPDEL